MGFEGALVDPGPPLTPDRLARYSRQLALPGFDETTQRRLANARVLVIGAGGLGSATVPYLASVGIGTIGIAETDVVELSNLHRQVAHGMSDIGRTKLASITETVAAIDPSTVLIPHEVRLDSQNILEILDDYDILLDGSDNFPTRYLSSDASTLAHKPLVWGAILRYSGQVSVSWADRGPTYRDLFPSPPAPDTVLNCEQGGVLPSVCATIGALMSAETVKLITGIGEPLIGRVTTYDALSGRFREVEYSAAENSEQVTKLIDYELFCGLRPQESGNSGMTDTQVGEITAAELAAALESGSALQLVDVREPFERAIVAIEPSELIPLGSLSSALDRIRADIPVVLYCHSGVRSAHALGMLHYEGFANVRHLAGGIDAYASQVDSSMARY